MRDIKFRAWDNKEMHYTLNEDGGYIDYFPLRSLLNHHNDFVWMQYTGLKDKNGKEIYEGDILNNDNNFKMKVGFDNGAFTIQNVMPIRPLMERLNNHEIIGNIHENPELL